MSHSLIMPRSIMRLPAIDQPAVAYPPALTEGERPCLRQKSMIVLMSCASSGETRALERHVILPLNVLARSLNLAYQYISNRKKSNRSQLTLQSCGGIPGPLQRRVALHTEQAGDLTLV